MTEAEACLAARYGDEFCSHEVRPVAALSAEMLAYDACVTGLQRTRYLSHMTHGAFEVLESRAHDTGKLTGELPVLLPPLLLAIQSRLSSFIFNIYLILKYLVYFNNVI